MPTVIIRPIPEWRETTISDSNETVFWEKINTYWADTMEAMRVYANQTNIPLSSQALFGVHECLARLRQDSTNSTLASDNENVSEADGDDDTVCPVIFDSWKCWPSARPGEMVTQNCPDFKHLGFDSSRLAYKLCTENGWWRHPETNLTWSNYTQCVNIQDLNFRQTVNVISLSGLGISLFALVASLWIFFYFKSLNCGRIKMHKNLFMALAMNNLCWILWYTCVLYQPQVWKTNPLWCRVLHVVKNYFMLSTYSWMLGEGAYLQLLLVNTWRVKTWQVWTIVVACWAMPIASIVPYAVARASSETENRTCWMDTGSSIWFLGIPVIVVMIVNLIFVINVIRVIKRKRGLQTENSHVANPSQVSTMKAARAALMLVPILGLHFILLPIRPEPGSTLEYIYEIVSAVSTSFQGFLVSLLFCFLNSEVLDLLKKKISRLCGHPRHGSFDIGESLNPRANNRLTKRGLALTNGAASRQGCPRGSGGSGEAARMLQVSQNQRKRRSSGMMTINTETLTLTTQASPSMINLDQPSSCENIHDVTQL